MGIPVYFKNLIENYHNLLIHDKYFGEFDVGALYLDLNCAIHPCCQEVMSEYKEKSNYTIDELERDMMKRIFVKINELVDLVNPHKLLYIAIDGVAPRAKMEQQRTRRYKTTLDRTEKIWNTNAITPGTNFMCKLGKFLNYEILHKLSNRGYQVIFSDSVEPGEGEHKILNYIRNTDNKKGCSECQHVIYGLDADLIMLSLIVSGCNSIYLLRERTEYNFEGLSDEVKYLYMDISKLKILILNEIKMDDIEIKISDNEIINDYIFLCFMLGNDFIKNIISLNIRYNGLDELIKTYKKLQRDSNGCFRLVTLDKSVDKLDEILSRSNLITLLEHLYYTEPSRLGVIKKIRMKQSMKFRGNLRFKKSKVSDDYDKYERNIPIIENNEEKWVDICNPNWENRYYIANILNISGISNISMDHIDHITYKKKEICKKYIESLYWVANYYFLGKVLWDWYYPYNYSPLMYDILIELKNGYTMSNPPPDSKSHIPYKSISQLLIVFPPQSHYLIPITGLEMKIRNTYSTHLFPHHFEMDYMFKRYWWEAHPRLMEFEEEIVDKILNIK